MKFTSGEGTHSLNLIVKIEELILLKTEVANHRSSYVFINNDY